MKKLFKGCVATLSLLLMAGIVTACKNDQPPASNSSNSEQSSPIDSEDVYEIAGLSSEWTMYCHEDFVLSAILNKNGEATTETITWTSSDPSIAMVDANGKVLAISAGTATITASANGKSATCVLTVAPQVGTPTLVIDTMESIAIAFEETYQLTPMVSYNDRTYNDVTLNYTSNNPEIVYVGETGLLTGINVGEAVITVSGQWRGLELIENITVVVSESISFKFTNTETNVIYTTNKDFGDGKTYNNRVTYGVTITNGNTTVTDTTSYVWKSTDDTIATVALEALAALSNTPST